MKRNRIAAGALALALVAPVTANAANEPVEFEAPVAEEAELNGRTLTKTQFETALKEASKAFNDNEAAKKAYEDADAAYEAAVERYNKAYDAYKSYDIVDKDGNVTDNKLELQNAFDIALKSLNNKLDGEALTEDDFVLRDNGEVIIAEDPTVDDEDLEDKELTEKEGLNTGEFDSAKEQAKQAYKEKEEAEKNLPKDSAEYREFQTATYEKDRLEEERDNAKAAYDKTQAELVKANSSVKTFAEAYNVVVQMENDGSIVVKEDKDAPAKDENKDITQAELDALQESVDEAKATIKAVEIVRNKATKISDKNKDYLDKLVADSEKLVTKGEAILKANKNKVAFSLFSTAYAAEEDEAGEATSEDVRELTDQLNSKTEEMKKAIEDVDAEEDAAEEEETPAEKDDDKAEEETPAEKDEDKADDKDEDKETPAKNEEKPAAKEDTASKPAVKSNSNRTAGKNAKTGIAGITGVAGVLAAASVAYAASKKNN